MRPSALQMCPSRNRRANERSALDARPALCFHFERHWPGASESERWATMRFDAMLIALVLCVTGCSTTIVAGARGDLFDASNGLPVQNAKVTRPRIPGGYLIPRGGLPASTVVADRHGHFDLPPYHHTVITLVSELKPWGADGSFEVAAEGYETRVISGRATSRTSWRIEAGKVLLNKP
jgi:hypothetical protein